MASVRRPTGETQREVREIALPLAAIKHERAAITAHTLRLREETIKMTDDREVGRFRGVVKRLLIADPEATPPTEAEWLKKCKELSVTFDYGYAAGQRRASHMVDYTMDEGFRLLGESESDIDWFILGWQRRINHRLRFSKQRILLSLGTSKSRENGIMNTINFKLVSVKEYERWIELEAA